MNSLRKNETWDIIELPARKKCVGCKWVYLVKYKANGTIERIKNKTSSERLHLDTWDQLFGDICAGGKN